MKNIVKISILLTIVLFVNACKNEKSLQEYLVNTSGKEGFYTGDLPISSILKANADVTDEIKETIKSIKKINIAFLPKSDDNTTTYNVEKEKLKNIFKDNDNYKSLMSMKMKGMNVKLYYSGKTDAIDEVIVFGYGEKNGVGVARLLGENMNPSKIIEMMNNVNVDSNNASFKNFSNILNL